VINGRENFTRAIEFRNPEYLPCELGVPFKWLVERDEAKLARIRELQGLFPKDQVPWVDVSREGPKETRDGVTRWVDEWGTGWADDGHGAKTDGYPLAASWASMEGFRVPDPDLPGRFDEADRELADRGDRYVRSIVWFTLFERFWMLRGFENALMDPYLHEREFVRLRDAIVEYNLAIIRKFLQRGVHGVFFSDDWGCQRGLLMDPGDWRKFYLPSYRRMFEPIRAAGAHVWMHLCGDVTAILADLIDAGLSVLNPVQPQAMDVRRLSRDFGGRLCFYGGVDVQGTMVHGTPGDVRREVHDLVSLFGGFGGGYVGGTSHSIMPETPLDNIIALYETFATHGGSPVPGAR
jgi:uroporphyrinogen decarboxylase